jgi:hypothetical protein
MRKSFQIEKEQKVVYLPASSLNHPLITIIILMCS